MRSGRTGEDGTSGKVRREAARLMAEMEALDRAPDGPETRAKRAELRARAQALGVALISLTITEDPIPDPEIEALSGADRRAVMDVNEALYARPAEQVERIRELIAKHPRILMLRSHLYVALSHAKQDVEAERVVAALAAEFPEYIFGVCNYVLLLMQTGRIDEARAIMETGPRGWRFSLTSFDATRDTFHITEAVTLAVTLGRYFLATGRTREAGTQLEMLEQIAPDHPDCTRLAHLIALQTLRDGVQRVKTRTRRGRWTKSG